MVSNKNFGKNMKRSALAVALGICFTGGVSAQSSVGSIFGEASANAAVTIENLDSGTSRQITSDASGHFTFSQLAPGRYRLTSGGVTREVQVKVGTGTQVQLTAAVGGDATNLDTVTVVGNGAINPIDVSSVESVTVFSAEQIAALPVGRDITSVALLAPGTVKGDAAFGNLASFGGASVAENGYYINGFDVTNIFNFLSYASLPFDAIGEQQVKTGGYGAEYGRSLGGVISLVTKRGTNEWKGGATVYYSPGSLQGKGPESVINKDPESLDLINQPLYYYVGNDPQDTISYNLYGGGPIIRDRLFFFGLIEGNGSPSSDSYGYDTSSHNTSKRPTGLMKLDWNITDNHLLELTAITNRSKVDTTTYRRETATAYDPVLDANYDYPLHPYAEQHEMEDANYSYEYGGEVGILKYTGYLTDNFTLSGQVGYLKSLNGKRTPALLGQDACSRAYDSRANPAGTVYIGCYNEGNPFVLDQNAPPDSNARLAWRIDGEWLLGAHKLRFGVDAEKFTANHAGVSYSGDGLYYRYFKRTTPYAVPGSNVVLPAGTDYVRTWDYRTTTGSFEVQNRAAYLEDNWQVTDKFLAYLGLRVESFKNLNASGVAFADSGNKLAPRIGFSWDLKGDASIKVYGNAGRYFIPVAGNTSVRMSGGESTAENYYYYSGQIDPATGLPVGGLGARINTNYNTPNPQEPNPQTVAATDLSPMYQDEYILGAQFQLTDNWVLGVRGIHREIGAGMDDFCGHQALEKWAEENGIDTDAGGYSYLSDASYVGGTSPTCYMMNPGKDLNILVDPQGDGNLVEAHVSAADMGIPEFGRKYNALEFTFERAKSGKWYLQGSYTFAKSIGTSEGYVDSTLGQTDAGITQNFDFAPYTDGTYGYLPNDRRHTLKLFGAYDITDEWHVAGNMLVQSGRPVSCYGPMPLDDPRINDSDVEIPTYDYYVAYRWAANSFYCEDANGDLKLGSRGDLGRTPWTHTFDAALSYTPNWAGKNLTVSVKVTNVLNTHGVLKYDEFSQNGTNINHTKNYNYLNANTFTAPRSVLFTVNYKF